MIKSSCNSFEKFFSILALIVSLKSVGQENSVGINTNTPNSNAVLDLMSPNLNQGFLVPRLPRIRRNAMNPNLTSLENGLIVFDTDDDRFYHWVDTDWVAGLGVLSSSTGGGDLQGEFPNLFIRSQAITSNKLAESAVSTQKILNGAITTNKISDNAITTDKVVDGAITGEKLETLTSITPGTTFGSSFTVLQISLDNKGRVVGLSETGILITSENIENLSLQNEDIANQTITISKIDPDDNTNRVLAINSAGQIFWEDRSSFATSALISNNIYIGNAQNKAENKPIGGDIYAINTGTIADFQINASAVATDEILDETINASDIGTDAVDSDEIVSEAVGTEEIANGSIQTIDVSNDAVTKEKINEDVAGLGLSKNPTNASLQINLGNGLKFNDDDLEMDLDTIAGDGLLGNANILNVNVDDITLETNIDQVRIKAQGVRNNELANDAITSDKVKDNEVNSADIANSTIINEDVDSTAAIEGTKINPDFGIQDLITTGTITGTTLTDGIMSTTSGVVTGVAGIDVDNINLDGNMISSTNTNGSIILDPNGGGIVDVSSSLLSNVMDPINLQDAATKNYVDIEISNNVTADNGLNKDPDGNIQLGGDLNEPTIIGMEASTSLTISDAAENNVVTFNENGEISIGNGSVTTGSGQIDFNGNVDANSGLDVSGTVNLDAGEINAIEISNDVAGVGLSKNLISSALDLNVAKDGGLQIIDDSISLAIVPLENQILIGHSSGFVNATVSGDVEITSDGFNITSDLVAGAVEDDEVDNNLTIDAGSVDNSPITAQDHTFTLEDDLDDTKVAAFELSSITSGTTRTLTVPDADGTIALTTDITASENLTQGSIYVGNGAGVESELDASGNGQILIGDGTSIVSQAITGDASLTNDGTLTIAAGAVEAAALEGLANGQLIIGVDGTPANNAKVTVSGDATLSNTGAFDLVAGAVEDDEVDNNLTIDAGSVDNSPITAQDHTFTLEDDLDDTKVAAFELSSITSGTTRTLTVPDADGTIALTTDITASENLTQGSIYVGNGAGVESELDASGNGQILIGDGASIVSQAITGDASLTNDGTLTITAGAVEAAALEGLANGQLIIGVDGTPTNNAKVTVSGDATLSNTGALDLVVGAVEDDEVDNNLTIDAGSVDNSPITAQDHTFTLEDDLDDTKVAAFELSNITSGTTRTLTVPDADGTIALAADITASENLTQGSIYVGNGAGVESELDASGNGQILIGDGTSIVSQAITGDASLTNDGTLTIAAGAVEAAALEGLANGQLIIGVDGTPANNAKVTVSGDATLSNTGALDLVAGAVEDDEVDNNLTIDAGSVDNSPITAQDHTFTLEDDLDDTKVAAFELSNITSGTTRTLTVPDADGTIALAADLEGILESNADIELTSSSPTATAIQINATNAAGGIDIDAGSGNGNVTIDAGGSILLSGSSINLSGQTILTTVDATTNSGKLNVSNGTLIFVTDAIATNDDIDSLVNGAIKGRVIKLVLASSDNNGLTLTENGNMKLSGSFEMDEGDVIELLFDGSNWIEMSRSDN